MGLYVRESTRAVAESRKCAGILRAYVRLGLRGERSEQGVNKDEWRRLISISPEDSRRAALATAR